VYSREQRLAALSLLAQGGTLSSVSRSLGISRAALRSWRDDGIEPAVRGSPCFVCASDAPAREAAYAALLGYYLGDGCVSRTRSAFALRISCDAKYPGIIAAVRSSIEQTHPGAGVCLVSAPGCVVVQNCWKHWPCLFPQHGPGRKHERALVLEPWQRLIIETHPDAFLRGLFHSDGCRSNNWAAQMVAGVKKRYDYPRWQFTHHSADIRRWCGEALDLVDLPWRLSNRHTISVSTRAGVARLDALVGPKS
jgi:hypothetical protein